MLRFIFCFIGVYTTIANLWRAYEKCKYNKITPKNVDMIICLCGSFLLTCLLNL